MPHVFVTEKPALASPVIVILAIFNVELLTFDIIVERGAPVCPTCTLPKFSSGGLNVTLTFGETRVIVALADFVGDSTEAAVTITAGLGGINNGAEYTIEELL